METAANVGIDNKNDIFAESYLLNFNNLPPVMAIPDLLTPGLMIKFARSQLKLLILM